MSRTLPDGSVEFTTIEHVELPGGRESIAWLAEDLLVEERRGWEQLAELHRRDDPALYRHGDPQPLRPPPTYDTCRAMARELRLKRERRGLIEDSVHKIRD